MRARVLYSAYTVGIVIFSVFLAFASCVLVFFSKILPPEKPRT